MLSIRRALAGAVLAGSLLGGALLLDGGSGAARRPAAAPAPRVPLMPVSSTPRARRASAAPAVGLRVLHLSDPARTITLPDGSTEARPLLTYVRYPASGPPGASDVPDAPAMSSAAPFPLIVFGHGFAVTPAIYRRLLVSWARAGYVVAAPVFPLESAGAPGGPNEADLVNQPGDMSFVISALLRASARSSGALAGLIDPHAIAVAGQSDGGDSALAVAYDPRYRDRRIDAAVILSGAEIPGIGSFAFPSRGPALLATQGTADTINLPWETNAFFTAARAPKYLLRLLGAEHLPPYTTDQHELAIVERLSSAFLDGYLKHAPAALARLPTLGDLPGRASLISAP